MFEGPSTSYIYLIFLLKMLWLFTRVFIFSGTDWVKPVIGDVYKAMCSWCDVVLPAQLTQLKQHAREGTHVRPAIFEGTG
jgi:hypothetical protein